MHFDKVMSGFYNRKIKAAIFVTFETHWSFLLVCLLSKICVVLSEQLNEQGGVCFALTNPHFIAAIWRQFQPNGSAAVLCWWPFQPLPDSTYDSIRAQDLVDLAHKRPYWKCGLLPDEYSGHYHHN